MHDAPQKNPFRRISLALLLAVGILWLWNQARQPKTPPGGRAGEDRLQTALSLPHPAQETTASLTAEPTADLLRQLQGQPRPAPQLQRGLNQRRVFDEPALRRVEAADTPPLHPFTGHARLRLDEQVPDHSLSVSALALGLNHETFAALAAQDSPRIVIPLEENLSVTFRVQKVMDRGPVTHSYFGVVEEHPESIAQLVYNDGAVTGHFVLYSDDTHPTRHYEIKHLTEDLVALHKLNPEAFQEHACGTCATAAELVEIPETEEDLVPVASVPENFATNGRVVDLVVGYGREARQADGGVAFIEARIIAAVDRMNVAFENSLVDGRMVLLGMIEDPDYLEADYSMSQTLYALNAGWHPTITSPLETVRAFRMSLGADLLHFVMNEAEYGGLAYITNWTSVTRRDQVTTSRFALEHELGHNLGALHAWADTSTDLTKDHARYGWRFRRASGSNPRRSIMAYDWDWSHVLHFSNPDVSYNIGGEMVRTGAVPGYNASSDATVDPRLVSGGMMGGQGAGYNGSNPELGANVAAYFNTATNSGIARAGSRLARAALAVTSPSSGQTLIAWENTPIEWVGGTWHSPARLELYQGASKVADIASLPQNGHRVHVWTPGPGLSGGEFRIRIVNNEGEAFAESAFSATFSIDAPPIPEYAVAIDFGKPGQETAGHWNNITGSGDWADDVLLSAGLVRYADGGQTGTRLRVQRVVAAARAGIGGLDIATGDQDASASFSISGTLPASAQRDIAYTSDTGALQFVFENLDDALQYRLEFQSLHTSATAAATWTLQPGTPQEQVRLVDRNQGDAHYSPVQVFEQVQTDGAGRIVLRSAGTVAQNINALELTAAYPQEPGPSGDPAQPDNPGGGTGTTYYLDAVSGNDGNSGLGEVLAWKTFQKAINTLQPGDTVLIREGDYHSTGNDEYKNWHIGSSGTPGQYITYRAYPGERPRFHVDTWNGIQLWNVAYVELDGLEILGLPDPAGLAAESDNSPARQALAQDRRYFGGGITVTHNGTQPHHIRIRNCVVHQVGGNGIAFRGGNLFLVENNSVYNSTHRSDAGNSAISFVELSAAAQQGSGYGVVVRNNTLHNNQNRVAFSAVGYITDGNGVIIDYCQNYSGDRILIANNLAYYNGGRAFHVYNSRNVDIVHNTTYHNLASPDLQWAGELSSDAPGGSSNDSILFHNNIAVARAERRAYNIANTTNWLFTRNVTQSPRAAQTSVDAAQNRLNTNPLFVNASGIDFRLQSASSAIDYALVFVEVPADALDTARQGIAPDAGAFEFVPPPPSTLLLRHSYGSVPAIADQHSSATFVRQAEAETVATGIGASPFHVRNDAASPARLIASDTGNGIDGAAQISGIQSNLFQWESGASANPYFEFGLEGAARLDTLRIVARSGVQWNNSGVLLAYDANRRAEISVRSSLDNYTSSIGTALVAGNAGAFAEQLLDLSALNPAGQNVTFRIYTRAYQSSDNWHRVQVDLVEVTGTAGSPPTDPYASWATANAIVGGPTDLTDGVPNLLRYALGGTAASPASAFRLLPSADSTGLTLNLPRIDDPALTYEIWATDTLLDWGDTPYWSGQGSGAGVVQVPTLGAQLYLHLRVRRD